MSAIDCDPVRRYCTLAEGHPGDCVSLADLKAQLSEALAVLKDVEWVDMVNGDGDLCGLTLCPSCEREKTQGHAPDCRLAKVLR